MNKRRRYLRAQLDMCDYIFHHQLWTFQNTYRLISLAIPKLQSNEKNHVLLKRKLMWWKNYLVKFPSKFSLVKALNDISSKLSWLVKVRMKSLFMQVVRMDWALPTLKHYLLLEALKEKRITGSSNFKASKVFFDCLGRFGYD